MKAKAIALKKKKALHPYNTGFIFSTEINSFAFLIGKLYICSRIDNSCYIEIQLHNLFLYNQTLKVIEIDPSLLNNMFQYSEENS